MREEYGYDVKRSVQYNGKAEEGQADVLGLPYLHCEIKRVESLNIDKAMEQAIRDAKDGLIPAVFHRKNGKKWKVTMELDKFMEIYNSYYSDNKLEERMMKQ